MDGRIEYTYGGMELFELTIPLRLKLLKHHSEMSKNFSPYYCPERIQSTRGLMNDAAARDDFHIGLAKLADDGSHVGFCISLVGPDRVGQLFAIWVEDEFKGRGIGSELSWAALQWLETRSPKYVEIHTLHENSDVLRFYERLGFSPQSVVLAQRSLYADAE